MLDGRFEGTLTKQSYKTKANWFGANFIPSLSPIKKTPSNSNHKTLEMVLLQNKSSSRKRSNPNPLVPPSPQPPKLPKNHHNQQPPPPQTLTPIDKMASVLAEAGCTLINPLGPPCLPSDTHKFRNHLHRLFSDEPPVRSDFLAGFASYVASSDNLRRYYTGLSLFNSNYNHGKFNNTN